MNPSKQVVDRHKDAQSVVASVRIHAAAVQAGLAQVLTPHLRPGETLPDLGLTLALIGRWIEARDHALTTADTAHQTELADDDGFRDARDRSAAELYAWTTDLREALDGVFGSEAMATWGVSGKTPRDPSQLAAFAIDLAARLSASDLPTPRFTANVDRLSIAADLRARVTPLTDALADVAREFREAERTLIDRDAAMTSFDRVFGRTTAALSALYRLGGQDEPAARIRPSGRRPGRLAGPTEPADDQPAEPPADAPRTTHETRDVREVHEVREIVDPA